MKFFKLCVLVAIMVALFTVPPMAGVILIGALGYVIGTKMKEVKDRYNQTVNDYKAFKTWQDQQRR